MFLLELSNCSTREQILFAKIITVLLIDNPVCLTINHLEKTFNNIHMRVFGIDQFSSVSENSETRAGTISF